MEYCFNGNLKDYITRYRDYYLDEINPSTGELREETYNYKSPSDSETFPMSDFLSSMHADADNEGESASMKNLRNLSVIFQFSRFSEEKEQGYYFSGEQEKPHQDQETVVLELSDIKGDEISWRSWHHPQRCCSPQHVAHQQ